MLPSNSPQKTSSVNFPMLNSNKIASCFLIGIPEDSKGSAIEEELKQRGLPLPSDWVVSEKIDTFGLKSKYIELIYRDDAESRAF